jgi:hypothetical protein
MLVRIETEQSEELNAIALDWCRCVVFMERAFDGDDSSLDYAIKSLERFCAHIKVHGLSDEVPEYMK